MAISKLPEGNNDIPMTSPYHAPRLEATQPTRPGTGTWSWHTRPGPAPSFLPPQTRLALLIPLLIP